MEYNPYPAAPAPAKKRKVWPWFLLAGIIAVVVIAGVASGQKDTGGGSVDVVTAAPEQPAAAPEAPVAPAGPSTDAGDGIHQVGVDIAAGQYKTPGPDQDGIMPNCYWARLANDSGEFSAILANGNLSGPGSVTVNDGEFVELMGGCTWTRTG